MNLLQAILIFAIRVYRWTISPAQIFLFGVGSGCRFTPSCSQYAVEAIKTRGAITGSWLAVKRICRCHPFGKCGCDPVENSFRRAPETAREARALPKIKFHG